MTRTKWVILIVAVLALGLLAIGLLGVGLFVHYAGPNETATNPFRPVYTTDQTPSAHAGYLRTTLTCGNEVYVNDYDEYALQLIDMEPTQVVGRTAFGDGKICAIPGQKPEAYLAGDVGSEMPAYEVFRNRQLPPFDWRTATFREMQYTGLGRAGVDQLTADPTLIEDVVRTLQTGTPVIPPPPGSDNPSNIAGLHLYSDQLPGMVYSPPVYLDSAGQVYLAENMAMQFTNRTTKVQARWIPAGPQLTKWVQTP
jgi:hypothetical protein